MAADARANGRIRGSRRQTGRRRSNLLALAVLACLVERPMHPYEMATTMRARGKQDSIKLNYGSLYGIVAALERSELIQRLRTVRDGRRPARTIYAITDAGRAELTDWETELLSRPVHEYPQLEAGLSLMAVLPPEEAEGALRRRGVALELAQIADRSVLEAASQRGIPGVVLVEMECRIAMRGHEIEWVSALADAIAAGTLDGIDWWRGLYDQPPTGTEGG